MGVDVTGPDGKDYQFPDGTDKAAAIKYFKKKGITAQPAGGDSDSTDTGAAPGAIAKSEDYVVPPPPTLTPKSGGTKSGSKSGDVVPDTGVGFIDRMLTGPDISKIPTGMGRYANPDFYKSLIRTTAQPFLNVSTPVIFRHMFNLSHGTPEQKQASQAAIKQMPPQMMLFMLPGGAEEGAAERSLKLKGAPKAVREAAEVMPEHPLSPEQQKIYEEKVDAVNKEYQDAVAQHKSTEASARKKWVEKMHEAKESTAKAQAVENRRNVLKQSSKNYVDLTQKNIHETHGIGKRVLDEDGHPKMVYPEGSVRGDLDRDFGKFRKGMEGVDVDAGTIFNAVQEAKADILENSPGDLPVFKNLMKELGMDEFVLAEGDPSLEAATAPVGLKASPFKTMWTHYSAIGNKMASGGLEGNVYRALQHVHNELGDALGGAAESMGQKDTWDSLRQRWSDYNKDWKDTRSIAKGGSPLAHALASTDSGFVETQIKGKAGDRMMSTMAKYRKYGAQPHLPAAARRLANEANQATLELGSITGEKRTLTKAKIKAEPGKYTGDEAIPPEIKGPPKRPKGEPPPEPKLSKGKRRLARGVGWISGASVASTLPPPFHHPFIGGHMAADAFESLAERGLKRERPPVPPVYNYDPEEQ